MDKETDAFLGSGYAISDGCGSGYAIGSGYGDGDGYGDGCGYSYGNGCGDSSAYRFVNDFGYRGSDSYGYGNGIGAGAADIDGNGCGEKDSFGNGNSYNVFAIKAYNGLKIHSIDRLPTVIYSIRGNYAKGAILNGHLTLEPCFIAKDGYFFAHGKTLREAAAELNKKMARSLPLEKRLSLFKKQYPTLETVVPGTELFDWHHVLTGSCRQGREYFCEEMGLNPETEKLSVKRFIDITKNAYGGSIILQLLEEYKEKK